MRPETVAAQRDEVDTMPGEPSRAILSARRIKLESSVRHVVKPSTSERDQTNCRLGTRLTSSPVRRHSGCEFAAFLASSPDLLVAYQGVGRDRADPMAERGHRLYSMPQGGIFNHDELSDFRGKPSVGAGL